MPLSFSHRGHPDPRQTCGQPIHPGSNPDLPILNLHLRLRHHTATGVLACRKKGRILERCNLEIHLWKNLDSLRGNILAGKGDLFLGHTEGFVRAAQRGAPVQLLVTTGWRKFYLVCRPAFNNAKTPARFSDFYGKTMAVAPPGSPAVPILDHIRSTDQPPISFSLLEPQLVLQNLSKETLPQRWSPNPW